MTTLKEYYDVIKDFTIAVQECEVYFNWVDSKGNNASLDAQYVCYKFDNTPSHECDLELYLKYFGSQEVTNVSVDYHYEVIEIHLSPDAKMKKICEEVADNLSKSQAYWFGS